MRDPARIGRVLATLRAEWLTQPDTRLTQLIVNATRVSGGVGNYGFTRLYNTEDEDVLAGAGGDGGAADRGKVKIVPVQTI